MLGGAVLFTSYILLGGRTQTSELPLVPAVSGYIPHITDFPWLSLTTPLGLAVVAVVLFGGRRQAAHQAPPDLAWIRGLPALARDDASHLASRVIALVAGWDWRHSYEPEPYILFRLKVVNTSVFRVSILGYQGAVRLLSRPCGLPAVMAALELQHGDVREIEIRQPITQSTANALQREGGAGSKVIVGFNEFHLRVQHAESTPTDGGVGEVAPSPARFDVVPFGAYPTEESHKSLS